VRNLVLHSIRVIEGIKKQRLLMEPFLFVLRVSYWPRAACRRGLSEFAARTAADDPKQTFTKIYICIA